MNEALQREGGDNRAEEFWEDHYRKRAQVWSGNPNAVLVDVVGALPAGRALDLGCGEGGDAIWLAGLGWRVTAVDVSSTALQRLAARVEAEGVASRIDFQQHDLAQTFPVGTFDLISAQYFHSPLEFPRDRFLQTAARAVAPDGLLLIVDHASIAPWSWNQDRKTRFPTPAETLATFDLDPEHWRTERLDTPQRQATGPEGQTATVTDNVIAVRRLGRSGSAQ